MQVDMERAISTLSKKRKIFASEADFQLELAWLLKELYPDAKVRLEYSPAFAPTMHLDILLIKDKKWVPIELKYRTRKIETAENDAYFSLKDQSAKDIGCYTYLHDIQRIETLKNSPIDFSEGYAIMITNDLSYTRKPTKASCNYSEFSLHTGAIKSGKLSWGIHTGSGSIKGFEAPIILKGSYPLQWKHFSTINSSVSGTFMFLISRIT